MSFQIVTYIFSPSIFLVTSGYSYGRTVSSAFYTDEPQVDTSPRFSAKPTYYSSSLGPFFGTSPGKIVGFSSGPDSFDLTASSTSEVSLSSTFFRSFDPDGPEVTPTGISVLRCFPVGVGVWGV